MLKELVELNEHYQVLIVQNDLDVDKIHEVQHRILDLVNKLVGQ